VNAAITHIIWDWNGTILGDSRALIASTIDAFHACGLPPVTIADYQRHHVQPIPLFYDRLAGRTLSAAEQVRLDECFRAAYARHSREVGLTADATIALRRWAEAGGTQSLLSMFPHTELQALVDAADIAPYFLRVDGGIGPDAAGKAPYLARHLARLDLEPGRVLLVGDSVDDAHAARVCRTRCLVYHAGADALHARDHFTDLGTPVVTSLRQAVDAALA
jgi:phosphoglycolate phosphatase-like HAD superfamily hydrolase